MNPHEKAANEIVKKILGEVVQKDRIFTMSLSGESGCGKTETGKAFIEVFEKHGIKALVLGQDNYFHLTPVPNDARRKADPTWLGPRKEVDLDLMNKILVDGRNGISHVGVPIIDYYSNERTEVSVDISNVKVIIAEGTYTCLLRDLDCRVFIDADYHDTLKYRRLRNRGNEVNDPFVENVLETEHKIIAGQYYIADIIIDKDYNVHFKSNMI
ncbi:MAG: hypothetical protein C0593_10415 [Marinilabiliales bacterium]|nr:MAG: hypothetical protein C0593_10415 [Marinilabiliales bacterium]